MGVVLMLCANVVGQIIIAGEGPGACVGFFILPLYGALAAWITVCISNSIRRKRMARHNKQQT